MTSACDTLATHFDLDIGKHVTAHGKQVSQITKCTTFHYESWPNKKLQKQQQELTWYGIFIVNNMQFNYFASVSSTARHAVLDINLRITV